MTTLSLTFPGEPMPTPRARGGKNGYYNLAAYTAYKKALAAAIHQEYGFWAWDVPPVGDKRRGKWLKEKRYFLMVWAYRSKDSGDFDNLAKPVADALKQAGILADDKQINIGLCQRLIDKNNPRLEFQLQEIPKDTPRIEFELERI